MSDSHLIKNVNSVVFFNRGRKGKKGQQQRKGKESPTESPTSPSNNFNFENATKVIEFMHMLTKLTNGSRITGE